MIKHFALLHFLLLFMLCPKTANGQNLKLIDASLQNWGGGIAGHTGNNYVFLIEFDSSFRELQPQAIWVEGDQILLYENDSIAGRNTHCSIHKGKVKCEIKVGTYHIEDMYHTQTEEVQELEKHKVKPPVPYKGVALLGYTYNGTTHYFEINKITTHLDPINYP